jgi:membrane protein DedA with SNARE-associated domain
MDDATRWLEHLPVGWALTVIALAAAAEYVFPPLPGDTLVAFGMFLAARAALGPASVLTAATAGALAGSLVAYAFGRWAGGVPPHRHPAWLRRPAVARALDEALSRFERRPRSWLLANRFLPALRAVFFVAAGMRRIPLRDVVAFGGLSALVWNAGLLALAYPAGRNFDELRAILDGYGRLIAGLVLAALLLWWFSRRRRRPR